MWHCATEAKSGLEQTIIDAPFVGGDVVAGVAAGVVRREATQVILQHPQRISPLLTGEAEIATP